MAKLAIGAHAAPQIHYMADPVRALSRNLAYSHSGLDLDTCYLPGLSFSGISSVGFSSDPYDQSPRYTPMDLSMTSASIEPFTAPIHPIIHSPPVERLGDSTFRPSKFQVEPEFRQLAISHTEPCQTEAMKQWVFHSFISTDNPTSDGHITGLENAPLITWMRDSSPKSGNPGLSTGPGRTGIHIHRVVVHRRWNCRLYTSKSACHQQLRSHSDQSPVFSAKRDHLNSLHNKIRRLDYVFFRNAKSFHEHSHSQRSIEARHKSERFISFPDGPYLLHTWSCSAQSTPKFVSELANERDICIPGLPIVGENKCLLGTTAF